MQNNMKKYLVIHHSASQKDITTAKEIDDWHKKRNWGTLLKPVYAQKSSLGFYAQYDYVIEGNGAIIQCRTDEEIGWHSGVWRINQESISICLCGNFNKEKPNKEQIFALRDLTRELSKKHNITKENIKGHNEIKPTACPGKNLDMNFVRSFYQEIEDVKGLILLKIDELKSLIDRL